MNYFLVLATVTFFSLEAFAQERVIFAEKRRMVVIEPERVAVKDLKNWKSATDLEDYHGTGYLVWSGKQYYGNQTNDPVSPITYSFEIKTPGIYQMKWRTRQHSSVERSDANNDSFFRFASGETPEGKVDFGVFSKVYVQNKEKWSWDTVGEPKHGKFEHEILRKFDAGIHKVEIAARSPGHAIDRIVIYNIKRVDFDEKRFDRAKEVLLEND